MVSFLSVCLAQFLRFLVLHEGSFSLDEFFFFFFERVFFSQWLNLPFHSLWACRVCAGSLRTGSGGVPGIGNVMLWKLLSVTSDRLMTSWWKLHYGHFFVVVVNIWDFVDLYFQSFCRIAFPFHLPPSFLLTGQLPRTSVADFSCWLSVPWTPSLQVFSSDMALFGRRICFVQFFGVCVCWTSHFVLHLFLPILFICSQPFLCSHPSFLNTTTMNYFQVILPFLYFFGARQRGFSVLLWLCDMSLVLFVPWRLYCLFLNSVISFSLTGFREGTFHQCRVGQFVGRLDIWHFRFFIVLIIPLLFLLDGKSYNCVLCC